MYNYNPYGGYSFASPLATSLVRPAYSPYVQPSYVQPIQYAQPSYVRPVQYAQPSYVQPVQYAQPAPIRGESRVEYVPYERPVVEMEEEYRAVQVPKQKWVTDYYPVEYQKEYIPQVTYEKQVEYRPVEKTIPKVEYLEVEREVRRQSFVQPVPQPSYYSPLSYSIAAPVPLAQSYVAPTYSYAPTFGVGSYYRPY